MFKLIATTKYSTYEQTFKSVRDMKRKMDYLVSEGWSVSYNYE